MQRVNAAWVYRQVPSKRHGVDVGDTTRRGYPVGKIYILGGSDWVKILSKVETFVRGNFEQKGNLNVPRAFHGAAVLNGNIYITGGMDNNDYNKSLKTCEIFQLSDNKSTLIAPMNRNRQYHGCCAHFGKLYVCGGKDADASKCCEVLETTEGEWRFIANMNIERRWFVVVSCGGFMWASGGKNDINERLNSTEFYDEKNDKWTMSSPMNEKRSSHSAVAFRDKIYILGGVNSTYLNTAEIFDTTTQQFTSISPMSHPRIQFAVAISGEKIFCFGGENSDSTIDSVESFNMKTGEWKSEKKLSQASCALTAVTLYES